MKNYSIILNFFTIMNKEFIYLFMQSIFLEWIFEYFTTIS